jgi:protein-disulfide isomerase
MSSRKEQKEAARAERLAKEQEVAAKAARTKRMRMLGIVLGVAAVAVAIAVIVSLGGTGGGGGVGGADEINARYKGIPQKGMFVGDENAPVTMVEFADPQCPFCAQYATEVLPTLIEKYVKTGKVRMQLRLQTFLDNQTGDGDSADTASMAVALGDQNVAWQFMDLFYENQEAEAVDSASDEYLLDLAAGIPGADGKKALSQRDSDEVENELVESAQEFDEKTGGGTPSFLIGPTGGTLESMTFQNLDPDEFSGLIDEAIEQAQ